MTIDRAPDTERYQGVVPLEGDSLTEAADTYFRQSEQLPTFIRLAVARHYRPGQQGGRAWTWRAGGLLVQKLTREGGRSAPREAAFAEEDWTRARTLAETVEDHELLDPLLPPDRLLYRLFHEEQVRAFRAIPLESYCSCSRDAGRGFAQALLARGFGRHGGRRRGVGDVRVLQQPLSLRPGLVRRRLSALSVSARPARKVRQASSCAIGTYSSGAWALAISPGPQITAGQPACSNNPASVV